eukprot:RCo031347
MEAQAVLILFSIRKVSTAAVGQLRTLLLLPDSASTSAHPSATTPSFQRCRLMSAGEQLRDLRAKPGATPPSTVSGGDSGVSSTTTTTPSSASGGIAAAGSPRDSSRRDNACGAGSGAGLGLGFSESTGYGDRSAANARGMSRASPRSPLGISARFTGAGYSCGREATPVGVLLEKLPESPPGPPLKGT